jgi:acetyl esterase/lipase
MRYADRAMKTSLLLPFAIAALLVAGPSNAQAQTSTPAAPPKPTVPPAGSSSVIRLWSGDAPGAHGTGDADVPKLYVYPASGAGPHAAVVVLPGGGYTSLVMEKEGAVEARWLNAHGLTAVVLQYRLGPAYLFPAPMLDGARALRLVRSRATALGVDPKRVGVWGFSAGGHLAGYLATVNDAGNAGASDPIDRESDRPDFAILSYARLSMDNTIPRTGNMDGLLGATPTQAQIDAISPVLHVTRTTSPSFIYATTPDEKVNSLNATAFYDALQRTGVPVELHIFERGPHGTGMGQNLKDLQELSIWPTLLADWMRMHGWMASE